MSQWLTNDEAVLIDVREPDEYARQRIPGSTLVPLSRFDPHQAVAAANPRQRIVMHCRGGRRSMDAARLAASVLPDRQFVSLEGGIDAWKTLGLPIETNSHGSAMSVMRQTQLAIGLAVLAGAALTWFVDPRFILIPAFFGLGLCFAGLSGNCGLAFLIAKLPWNSTGCAAPGCTTPAPADRH